MIPIKLLFIACMTIGPNAGECELREVPSPSTTMTGCLLGAQVYFAMVTAKEPGLEIGSWRCATGDQL